MYSHPDESPSRYCVSSPTHHIKGPPVHKENLLPVTKMLYVPEESAGVHGGWLFRPTTMEGRAETAEKAAKLARTEAASIAVYCACGVEVLVRESKERGKLAQRGCGYGPASAEEKMSRELRRLGVGLRTVN